MKESRPVVQGSFSEKHTKRCLKQEETFQYKCFKQKFHVRGDTI